MNSTSIERNGSQPRLYRHSHKGRLLTAIAAGLTGVLSGSLCFVQSAGAAAGDPVFHAHAGRIHKHPLPIEGLAHRHGGGAPGVKATSTNRSGSITSSVDYGGASAGSNPDSKVIRLQTRQTTPNNRLLADRIARGDAQCRPGERYCNPCAANVVSQFKQAAAGQLRWQTSAWRFNWQKRYPPKQKRPLDIFRGDSVFGLGVPTNGHIQGFVRTNSSRFPFAGSHSHKSRGAIFVIRQDDRGQQFLSTLHPSDYRHPSGVQVLGDYLLYGEKEHLSILDLASHQQSQRYRLKLPGVNFGGGLGAVKLRDDSVLLLTTGPGGQKKGPRHHRFYRLTHLQQGVPEIELVNTSRHVIPDHWPAILNYSENLSLLTECDSGVVYAIHTTGDENGLRAITGNGYWRLSRLSQRNGRFELQPLSAFATPQNMANCHNRAAATVHVNRARQLEFYCHGYARSPGGSLFNVLGGSGKNEDAFRFRRGTLN